MNSFAKTHLRPLAPGILLSLLAIAFGFGMGTAFGAAEDVLKGNLKARAEAVMDSVYGGDTERAASVVSKSWTYFKRAHLHANALGTSALAACVLLALLGTPGWLARLSAAGFGTGALLYGVFWLLAGLAAPGLGSTGAAKESLAWIGIPGSGLCMLGLAGTLLCAVLGMFGTSETG
jgi:hypothetical protein